MKFTRLARYRSFYLDELLGNDGLADLEDLEYVFSERSSRWQHQRMDWVSHVSLLIHEHRFEIEYRMSYPAFNQLKHLLKPTLKRKKSMSRSLRPIDMNIIVGTALRYLAGGSINDIRHIFKTSYAEAYNCVHCFINAINRCAKFDINLPTTAEERVSKIKVQIL